MFGTTCMLLCGFLAHHLRAADRGCEVSNRPSLRPLGFEGGEIRQSSGEMRREDAKACLQHSLSSPGFDRAIQHSRDGCD
ncbi:hypothetical protein [Bradyrhizobium japonicum]|uniref:hypothetical protein n=1 Tax=Bradyrhizobium japonicum TaxID=375 RepID=UPI00138AB5DA|nr:hypothetical protein [Bradyrhizobium japonicum]